MISMRVVNNDFVLQGNGKLEKIEKRSRLSQNMTKILITDKENELNGGEIPFRYNKNYGTNLNYIKPLNQLLTIEDAIGATKTEVKDAVKFYAFLQSQKLLLGLDPSEILTGAEVLAFAERIKTQESERVAIKYELEIETQDGGVLPLSAEVAEV